MKMRYDEAYNALSLLVKLREKGRLGLVIAKNIRILREEISEYISKRDEYVMKMGSMNSDGLYTLEGKERIDEFLSIMNEYNTIEFEFTPQRIDEETFCSGDLTSDQMVLLSWMIDDSK